jgi:hypothetical protein
MEAFQEWKAHPVIVAIVAGAAVVAFWESYAVPLHTQALRNQIASNAELVANARATEEKLQSAEQRLKDALAKVRALEKPNLFSLGNPYPVGLGLVKVGQPIEDLRKAYPDAKVDRKEGLWRADNLHSVFGHIVFYFDERTKEKKITHILFNHLDHSSTPFLGAKLVEMLGPPLPSPRSDYYHLKATGKTTVFHRAADTYFVIMEESIQPKWWPSQ